MDKVMETAWKWIVMFTNQSHNFPPQAKDTSETWHHDIIPGQCGPMIGFHLSPSTINTLHTCISSGFLRHSRISDVFKFVILNLCGPGLKWISIITSKKSCDLSENQGFADKFWKGEIGRTIWLIILKCVPSIQFWFSLLLVSSQISKIALAAMEENW